MSWQESLKTLNITNPSPSSDEVNKAYRQLYIDNRKLHPDTGGDPTAAMKLNVAKDTLLGKLRPDRGSPAPSNRPAPPAQEHETYKKEKIDPPPAPEGGDFKAALMAAGPVDWLILSNIGRNGMEIVRRDDNKFHYWIYTRGRVLIGRGHDDRIVIMQLTETTHDSSPAGTLDKQGLTVTRWTSVPLKLPLKADIMKAGLKVVKEMWAGRGQARWNLLETKVTPEFLGRVRSTLTFKDAVAGAGLVSDSTKVSRIELEPTLNKARLQADWNAPIRAETYKLYDWALFIDGKKTELEPEEVQALKDRHVLSSVFGWNYEGKKNLSGIRGGRMKMTALEVLENLAKALRPGQARDKVQESVTTMETRASKKSPGRQARKIAARFAYAQASLWSPPIPPEVRQICQPRLAYLPNTADLQALDDARDSVGVFLPKLLDMLYRKQGDRYHLNGSASRGYLFYYLSTRHPIDAFNITLSIKKGLAQVALGYMPYKLDGRVDLRGMRTEHGESEPEMAGLALMRACRSLLSKIDERVA